MDAQNDNLTWYAGRVRIMVAVIVMAAIGGGYWFITQREEKVIEEPGEVLAQVETRAFSQLSEGEAIEKVAVIESASRAPLVARTGGRVTKISAQLGEQVNKGVLVVEVDGASVASPARVQAAAAGASLAAFNEIEKQALASIDQGIATAKISVEAAKAGKALTAAQVNKARQQADLAVKQAELAFDDLEDDDDKTDALTRAADLRLQAAELAQDQTTDPDYHAGNHVLLFDIARLGDQRGR